MIEKLVLDMKIYKEPKIIIYNKKGEKIRTIKVKDENKIDAVNTIYRQYVKEKMK